MAGKPKPMSQIKQLLQLHQQGKGIKFIARSLGISKNTVKAYLAKVSLSPLDVQGLLALDSHSQFCYHLSQQLIARKPSMVLQHQAGEKLFIDFAGKKLSYTDIDTGEIVPCQVFVACLPYSDYSFAMAVRSQSIADFLYALGMLSSGTGRSTAGTGSRQPEIGHCKSKPLRARR